MTPDSQAPEEEPPPVTQPMVETWIKEALYHFEFKLEKARAERDRMQNEEKFKQWRECHEAWMNRVVGFAIGLATGITAMGIILTHTK